MASGVYPLEYETICTVCYLEECCEFSPGPGKRNVCPLRIVKRLKLTADQGKAMSEIARHWGYQPRHFLRMAEQWAQRNRVPVGGLNA